LRYSFSLFKLCFVECYVVILSYFKDRLCHFILLFLVSLVVLHNYCPSNIQIVELVLQDIIKSRIMASINRNLLPFEPKILLERFLLEVCAFKDNIVFSLQDKAFGEEVLLF